METLAQLEVGLAWWIQIPAEIVTLTFTENSRVDSAR